MSRREKPSATVRVVKDPRPPRPRVDLGAEFEGLARQMFTTKVNAWVKGHGDGATKEEKGNVVDNLAAQWVSALESIVDAAVDSYLSTGDVSEVECPECDHVFALDGEPDSGAEVECPKCSHKFELPEQFECPECGEALELPEDIEAGELVECPECKKEIKVG